MLLLLVLACSGSDPADDGVDSDSGSTSTAETGTIDTANPACFEGELTYVPNVGSYEQVPLVDGLTLVLQQGPQGGYHIDMNGVISPVPNVGVVVRAELLLDDATQVAFTDGSQAAYTTWSECEGTFGQARMFWNADLDAATLCSFSGRPATLSQTVEDLETGRSVSEVFDVVFDVSLFNGTCADVK